MLSLDSPSYSCEHILQRTSVRLWVAFCVFAVAILRSMAVETADVRNEDTRLIVTDSDGKTVLNYFVGVWYGSNNPRKFTPDAKGVCKIQFGNPGFQSLSIIVNRVGYRVFPEDAVWPMKVILPNEKWAKPSVQKAELPKAEAK